MSDAAIRARWQLLSERRRTALIPYLTAGYPTRDDGVDAARDLMNELRGALKEGAAPALAAHDEAD